MNINVFLNCNLIRITQNIKINAYMLLYASFKIKCLICINHTGIFISKIELGLHRLLNTNITCLTINRVFL
jgi:hypothetical protein